MTTVFSVNSEERGMALDDFLVKHLSLSKKNVKKLLDQAGCLVNGRAERMGKRPLFAGDKIEVQQQEGEKQKAFDPTRIIYEEEGFLLYDKPVGITVDQELLQAISQKGGLSSIVLIGKPQVYFSSLKMKRLAKSFKTSLKKKWSKNGTSLG